MASLVSIPELIENMDGDQYGKEGPDENYSFMKMPALTHRPRDKGIQVPIFHSVQSDCIVFLARGSSSLVQNTTD